MQKTIDETSYRRQKQIAYNLANNLVPTALNKKISSELVKADYEMERQSQLAAESFIKYETKADIEKAIREKRKTMELAAKELDFILAAKLRDEIKALKERL